MKRAEILLDGPMKNGRLDKSRLGAPAPEPEVIEDARGLTVLLEAPGYRREDLRVELLGDDLLIETPEFSSRQGLPSRVVRGSEDVRYLNGVLCVRMTKAV